MSFEKNRINTVRRILSRPRTVLLGMFTLAVAVMGCASAPMKPETSPFTAAKWISADSSWQRALNQAENLLRRNHHLTARVLRNTADELVQRRTAALQGPGPAMTPDINRRVTALIGRLESARRSAKLRGRTITTMNPEHGKGLSMSWPVQHASVSSGFGTRRDPFEPARQTFHDGIDLVAPMGSRVLAPSPGLIVGSGLQSDGCGIGVTIDHPEGFRSRFCHLSRVDVRVGEHVIAGDAVGRLGRSGRTTGPHLHWSLRRNGVALDPLSLMNRHGRE